MTTGEQHLHSALAVSFIRELGLALLVFCLVFAFASFYYERRVEEQDNFTILMERAEDPAVAPVVVFLGDSHPAIDISSGVLPETYLNFSYPGSNTADMYVRARMMHRLHKGVRYFLIPLDYHQFSSYRTDTPDFSRYVRFAPWEDIAAAFRPDLLASLSARMISRAPLLDPAKRNELRSALAADAKALVQEAPAKKAIDIDAFGGLVYRDEKVWSDLPAEDREREAAERTRLHFGSGMMEPELIASLREIITWGREQGVRFIGVRYPLSLEYRKAMESYDTVELEAVLKELGSGFHVLDYRSAFDGRQDYFRDGDHLNATGSKIFTQRLVQDIQTFIGR